MGYWLLSYPLCKLQLEDNCEWSSKMKAARRQYWKTQHMCAVFLPPYEPHFDGHAEVHCLVKRRDSRIVSLFAVKMHRLF